MPTICFNPYPFPFPYPYPYPGLVLSLGGETMALNSTTVVLDLALAARIW